MAHEAHVLGHTVTRIEADEGCQRREYLVGPHGEYTRELASLERSAQRRARAPPIAS